MTATVIATAGLRKSYGQTPALQGLDLDVRRGEVFGFLGPNGAGKTTTIRLLLDLIRPSAGTATVMGMDPQRDGVAIRARTGYLPGDFVVNGRQTGRELLTHLSNLRGGVGTARIPELADRLDVDLSRTIRSLSRGNRQKIGLVQAFMSDPELIIMDEPTSGLDPFLQQEFTRMAREVAEQGRTVFMSSHVMSEVQKTSDRVGIIRDGVLVTVAHVTELLESAARDVEIVFADPPPAAQFAALDGVSEVHVDGTMLRCVLDGRADMLVKKAAEYTVLSITSEEPDLEDVFFRRYSDGPTGASAPDVRA